MRGPLGVGSLLSLFKCRLMLPAVLQTAEARLVVPAVLALGEADLRAAGGGGDPTLQSSIRP